MSQISQGSPDAPSPARWTAAVLVLTLGVTSAAACLQTVLEDETLARPYVSTALWLKLVEQFGGQPVIRPDGLALAVVPAASVYLAVGAAAVSLWIGGAALLVRAGAGSFRQLLVDWGLRGWRWWILAGAGLAAWLTALLASSPGWIIFLGRSSPLWMALVLNLWAAEWFALRRGAVVSSCGNDPRTGGKRAFAAVVAAMALYTLVFTAMNWGLWFNLQIPHGDSAMYEEHLWNFEHGKGFRSYLDQGLFLGEHLQVVHLLLIPLHVIWPSQLLMELCQSIALALTAAPLYCIALRHSGSPRAAAYLSIAALLYFPLQYLDISIDFKTFRPSALGIPLLLATIDQMERRRWKTMAMLALLTLSAQEDFAIPLALLGLWLALTGGTHRKPNDAGAAAERSDPAAESEADRRSGRRRIRLIGAALFVLMTGYLFLAVKVVIPWFRSGATVHYANYFEKFGETPTEIVRTMVFRPGLVLAEVLDAPTFLYAMYLLAPLGFLPLLSPGRLAVGLPLFGLLCLNELAQDPPGPFHHFHAPLVPILLWAAAAGLARLSHYRARASFSPQAATSGRCSPPVWNTAVCGARFALGCALLSGAWYTLSPLGLRFWDSGRVVADRPTYWKSLYIPDARARAWEEVAPLIPATARVAATDFVHARLTHCDRSYDYSRYARRVAGYEDRVPADTNYIVIDLQHPYSRSVLGDVRGPADVREMREEPLDWEVLTDPANRYFVVLHRRERTAAPNGAAPRQR